MKSSKETVQEILDQLDDDVSLEDIQYQIYVRQKIESGIKDIDEGRTVSHEDMKRRTAQWIEQSDGPK